MRTGQITDHPSWNHLPESAEPIAQPVDWRDSIPRTLAERGERNVLAYGNGRTYGDVCLNPDNLILPTRGLNRVLAYDRERGVITAEAGLTFRELLALIMKDGWFPPVTPGTSHLTLGGAIANDVHGKDHPTAGTFGRHISELELHRSDRPAPMRCSARENADLFAATIGGLGLTGLIGAATFPLQRIPGPMIETRTRRGDCIAMFAEPADPAFPHRVAWLDASAPGDELGRGLFSEGRFIAGKGRTEMGRSFSTPWLPSRLLGPRLLGALSRLFYLKPFRRSEIVGFEPFFYPLDRIDDWGRAYGRAGFYQHQSLIPAAAGPEPVRALLRTRREYQQSSFVTVLKDYGDLASPGLLSFPQAGLSLALDVPNLGERTLRLLDALDEIVLAARGRINPAKDARMSPATFRAGFPRLAEFSHLVDPAFSSGFWRRMHAA